MAEDRDSLLREVDDELRRDQMQKIWERYNGLILGAAALVILAVGAFKIIQARRISAAEAAGSEFAAAQNLSDEKKKPEAEKAFSTIVAQGPAGYAALAALHLAGEQSKAGKTADAVATYDSLASRSGVDDMLKGFAQLQAASLRMADADYAEIQNRLTPLSGDDQPFAKSAQELLGIAAYKAKKFDEARKYLEPLLIDPSATDAIQDRVKVVMADIAAAEVSTAKPTPATAPSPASSPTAGVAAPMKAEPEKKKP